MATRQMRFGFAVVVALVFIVLLTPFYLERHLLTGSFRNAVGDCYTTLNGGTVCEKADIAGTIAIAGMGLIAFCLTFIAAIGIAIPVSRAMKL